MFLEEYISNKKDRKYWINKNILLQHFKERKIPNYYTEEWKNFRTNLLDEVRWKVLEAKTDTLFDKEIENFKNTIVIKNGFYDPELSTYKRCSGINVFKTQTYLNKNPNFAKKIYNNPSKYAEKRLSGIVDANTTSLLSLNTLLNEGIVIEIEKNKKINEIINLLNLSSYPELGLIVNPYIFLICKEGAEVAFKEVHFTHNCWINSFIETYVEANGNLNFSKVLTTLNSSIKTSSMNFHIRKNGNLNLKVFNREKSKEDIRVYLKEKNASAKVSGILLSNKNFDSDILCKIVHEGENTFSDQKWRLISIDNSRTSINGKICVNKGAKKSNASFVSKSLILNDKSSSFSKPELEILEDDVKCQHGASFGEIDKDIIFYLQSRGIKKFDAMIMLIYAFINEIGYVKEGHDNIVLQEIDNIIKNIGKNDQS